jgi:hypothetical protein
MLPVLPPESGKAEIIYVSTVVSGGGHGGRPLPLGYHLRLCFTGVPRMGPSMPLTALSLADRQDRSPGLEEVRIVPNYL